MASFDDRKQAVLRDLPSDEEGMPRAGGVDNPIEALIDRINWHPHFFTTSSCSGRISIFSEAGHPVDDGGGGGKEEPMTMREKKGGDWVYCSHETAEESEVLEIVQEYCVTMEDGLLVFRYEPSFVALECRTPAAAQLLVACAVSAGFRESGISGMGKRNIVGVRCSIRLEVPIVQAGRMLVTDDYLRFLTALANKKMDLNHQRTDTFLVKFIEQVEDQNLQTLSESKRSMLFQEHPPSELSSNGGFEEVVSANEARHFQDLSEEISSKAKESKKELSVLKGRQLRVLA